MHQFRPTYIVFRMIGTLYQIKLLNEEKMDLASMREFAHKNVVAPRVLVVGLNPSDDSPNNEPFHENTKSGKTVREWFKDTDCYVEFENLYDYQHKHGGKPPKSTLIVPHKVKYYSTTNCKIIACGSVVQEVLRKGGIEHFAIPHPSGLCRFWNDKQAGDAKIKEMLQWIAQK